MQQSPGLLRHRLRAAPGAHERQGAGTAFHQVGQQARGVGGGGPPQRGAVLAGALGQRRLPQCERGARPGGAVLGDRRDGGAHEAARGRGGIGDGRRREHEDRIGTVAVADPPQPPQHVPDVRAEDPPVGVALVDDDVGHPAERARPLLVRRKDPPMEHVGVGHDPAGVAADPVPLLAGGVTVVGGRADGGIREGSDRGELVAGQGLRRRQVQHAGAGVLGQPRQGRQLVGERLPRRRPRGDHDVPAVPGELCRVHLVPPRRQHPAALQPLAQGSAHPRRPRQRAADPHRHVVHVGDRTFLLVGAREHRGQEVGARRHGGSRPDRVERRHATSSLALVGVHADTCSVSW